MKDYSKIFKDDNKHTFDHQEQFQTKANKRERKIGNCIVILALTSFFLLIYSIYGWTFLGFRWEWAANLYNADLQSPDRFFIVFVGYIVLLILAFVMFAIISYQANKSLQKLIDADKETLEGKAYDFAITVYFDDMISALSTVFKLDDTFTNTFKKMIVEFTWFEHGEFRNHGHGLTKYHFDHNEVCVENRLMINHEESIYHLQKWEYEKDAFRFFFEKINANGLVEKNVELRLPVGE